jgi:hypothetical protein
MDLTLAGAQVDHLSGIMREGNLRTKWASSPLKFMSYEIRLRTATGFGSRIWQRANFDLTQACQTTTESARDPTNRFYVRQHSLCCALPSAA